jgi:hypothetical protein
MIPEIPSIFLDERSRLNFGKPTPVEHNLRMKSVGCINPTHLARLLRYFDEVNNTNYCPTEENMTRTESKHRGSKYRSSRPSITNSITEQEYSKYEDSGWAEGERNEEPRTGSQRNLSHRYPGLGRQVDVASSRSRRRNDDGDTSPCDPSNTTSSSLHATGSSTESKRRNSTYGPSRPSVAGLLPEREHVNDESGRIESEGNEESQAENWRYLNHGYTEPRHHVDVASSGRDRRKPDDRDTPPRDRSNTTRSSPYPTGSRRPSTAVHHRSHTLDHEQNPPGNHQHGMPRGYR